MLEAAATEDVVDNINNLIVGSFIVHISVLTRSRILLCFSPCWLHVVEKTRQFSHFFSAAARAYSMELQRHPIL